MPDDSYANIKALVSRIDRAADLELTRDEIRGMASADYDDAYATLRHDYLDRVGLLCIYPIAKDSQPRGRKQAKPRLQGAARPGRRRPRHRRRSFFPEDNSAQVHPVPAKSARGAVPVFRPVRFPGPLPEPAVPIT